MRRGAVEEARRQRRDREPELIEDRPESLVGKHGLRDRDLARADAQDVRQQPFRRGRRDTELAGRDVDPGERQFRTGARFGPPDSDESSCFRRDRAVFPR
jgi:hypothetical protein